MGVIVRTCYSLRPGLTDSKGYVLFQKICFGSDSDRNIVFCRSRSGPRHRAFGCNCNAQYSGSTFQSSYRNIIIVYSNAEHIGVIHNIRFNYSLAGIGERLCFILRNVEACRGERFALN